MQLGPAHANPGEFGAFGLRASDFEFVLASYESVSGSEGLTEPDRKSGHAPNYRPLRPKRLSLAQASCYTERPMDEACSH